MTKRPRTCLLAIAALVLAAPAFAQGARIERASPFVIDIAGGSGTGAWRLRYGTENANNPSIKFVDAPPDRAYFAHASYLRVIDTTRGIVLGRWRFPGMIAAVTPSGAAVEVTFEMPQSSGGPQTTVRFDPASGVPPDFETGSLRAFRTAETEVWQLILQFMPNADPWLQAIPNAATHVPMLEDLVARDRLSPMLQLLLAKLLRDAGDPRADAALAALFQSPSTDFAEWFRISAILNRWPSPEAAAAAFDRAFRDFIRRDRDPRLVDTLIGRMVLYPTANWTTASDELRRVLFDRIYLVAPTGEATERAWSVHAAALAARGDTAGAAIWRARAEETERHSRLLSTIPFQLRHDRFKLLALGTLLAALILVAVCQARYSAQRRMHAAAAIRNQEPLFRSWLGLHFWSRRERWALLAIVTAGWLAMGYSWTYARVMMRSASLPIQVGQLAGLMDFTRAYPASPERDLLYAVALQQVGKLDDADRLYRSLPQFAESWNNLGVMHARAGNADAGRDAFRRALEIDPALPEAVFNSTGEARDSHTETFRKYAPDRKMIAIPGRERFLRGYLGSVWTSRYARTLMGPLEAYAYRRGLGYLDPVLFAPTKLGGLGLGVLLVTAVVLLAFVRYQDVSVPPGRVAASLEWVFPGTSPAWRWAGAPVLVAWATLALATILQLTIASPYLLIAAWLPGALRAFGYPNDHLDLNPPMTLLVTGLAVLWLANMAAIQYAARSRQTVS